MNYRTGLLAVLILTGCATAPAPETVTEVAPPPLPHNFYRDRQQVTVLNADNLRIHIKVGKTGSLANLGHEHAIEVGALQGYAWWPDDPGEARADIQFRLQDLQVDTEAAKATLKVDNDLTEKQKTDTYNNMLKSLSADEYPTVRVKLSEFEQMASEKDVLWKAQATLWLHGTRRDYPVNLSAGPNSTPTNGTLAFRQTQFGIQPFSALNGGLQVADELLLHFRFRPHL